MTSPYVTPAPAVPSAPVSPLTYPASGATGWDALINANISAAASQADAAYARALQSDYHQRGSMVDAYRLAASDRPIITLRYDDNSIDNQQLANACAALALPASFAVIRNAIVAGNGQMQIADWIKAQLQGHEIMCHSYFHDTGPNTVAGGNYPAGTSIEAQMFKEFITAAEDMYGLNLWTQQWIQPGTWTSGSGQNQSAYAPFLGGIGAQPFYEQTEIGKLIRARFLGVSTYTNDGFGVQTGYRTRPNIRRYGKSTNYYDNKSIAQIQAIVNAAIAGNNHLQMFCHSGTFKLNQGSPDLATYISTFLPWLRAQVDAGRCYVMTESAGSMAAQGKPINLVGDNAFSVAASTGVDAATITTHISDHGDSYQSVVGPDGSTTVTALQVNPASNCSVDMEYASDVPLRSLRAVVYAKGVGGASQLAPTVSCGGNSVAQALTPISTVTLNSSTWTKVEFIWGTAPSNQWTKPIFSVPSGAVNPALVTNPVITIT